MYYTVNDADQYIVTAVKKRLRRTKNKAARELVLEGRSSTMVEVEALGVGHFFSTWSEFESFWEEYETRNLLHYRKRTSLKSTRNNAL